ncbi:MAG: hypothetical protein HC855_07970 [Rhizobiales bacterium]|nr:hypothetical protein [Hyphomicrobiales bacterium]
MRTIAILATFAMVLPEAALAASTGNHQPLAIRLHTTAAKPKAKPKIKFSAIVIVKTVDVASPGLQ